MTVKIDSIEISRADRYGNIEAEIEFHDQDQLIKDIGVSDCVLALDTDDILDEIGWEAVKKKFADEIKEERDEAFEEGKQSVESEN